jgi:hypothetical protein
VRQSKARSRGHNQRKIFSRMSMDCKEKPYIAFCALPCFWYTGITFLIWLRNFVPKVWNRLVYILSPGCEISSSQHQELRSVYTKHKFCVVWPPIFFFVRPKIFLSSDQILCHPKFVFRVHKQTFNQNMYAIVIRLSNDWATIFMLFCEIEVTILTKGNRSRLFHFQAEAF